MAVIKIQQLLLSKYCDL